MQARRISAAVLLCVVALAGLPRWPAESRDSAAHAVAPVLLLRGFVSEARACKPSAPIEITLVSARTEGDGSVTLEWRVAARAVLAEASWSVQLPEGAQHLEGPLAGRLGADVAEEIRLRLRLPEAAEGVPACVLVAEARLGHEPEERVVARQALHRLVDGAAASVPRPARLRSAPAFAPSLHRVGG